MYVQVVTIDGKQKSHFTVSKLTKIADLKKDIEKEFDIPKEKQRLFFRGKHLENDGTLYEYSINLNNVIQVMIKSDDKEFEAESDKKENINNNARKADKEKKKEEEEIETTSDYYKVGDFIDCTDTTLGAWFEAVILKVIKKSDKTLFKVKWDLPESRNDEPFNVEEKYIRPRAWKVLDFNDLDIGQKIMVNYNLEEPKQIGNWYDLTISKIRNVRTGRELKGTIHIGDSERTIDDCEINTKQDIYQIEKPVLISERNETFNSRVPKTRRKIPAICSHCNDNPKKKCKECSCRECGKKSDPHLQLLCDECDTAYHISCLKPPLTELPDDDDWYCPDCKVNTNEIVKVGEKVAAKKKHSKVVGTTRDWGKGMACVGRTKVCTIVSKNHRGPVPGIEVGTLWKYRVQVSEAGVHRPHVAGISGNSNDCAYSIVLSGGYEDDVDNGDEFYYTGSGGRDLSGNKRTAKQSCDQQLTLMNKALALNCNAKLDEKKGATAENWKKGIPIRVVRNYKLAKHSTYAPEDGNRYDGIYKVIKYWPEKGQSGYIVWRYLLRRDDPTPAPWTKQGKARIEELGLEMVYPEGYHEAQEKKNGGIKRKTEDDADSDEVSTIKKRKANFKLDKEISDLIKKDKSNKKLWDQCMELIKEGSQAFYDKVTSEFACTVCQDLVYQPVTIPCAHNICISCLKRSFEAESYNCPMCRNPLDKDYKMQENKALSSALLSLFPGYDKTR